MFRFSKILQRLVRNVPRDFMPITVGILLGTVVSLPSAWAIIDFDDLQFRKLSLPNQGTQHSQPLKLRGLFSSWENE